jgi:hypothetical protein
MGSKSDGCEVIAKHTSTGSADTVTFSSIPQTFQHLQVLASISNNGTSNEYTLVHFNGDTTSYGYSIVYGDTSGEPSVMYNGGITYAYTGWHTNSQSTDTTGRNTYFEMWVPDYSSSSKLGAAIVEFGVFNNNNVGGISGGFHWDSTAAITSITFTCGTGSKNWYGGQGNGYDSTWTLYGWT